MKKYIIPIVEISALRSDALMGYLFGPASGPADPPGMPRRRDEVF